MDGNLLTTLLTSLLAGAYYSRNEGAFRCWYGSLLIFWIGAMLKTPRHEKTLVHFNFTAYTPNPPPKKNLRIQYLQSFIASQPSPSSPVAQPSPTFSSHKVPTGTVKFRLAEVTSPGEEKPATSKRPTWRQQATDTSDTDPKPMARNGDETSGLNIWWMVDVLHQKKLRWTS